MGGDAEMNNKGNTKIQYKWFVILIDIIIIVMFLLIKTNIISTNKNNIENEVTNNVSVKKFKSFLFDVPNNINFDYGESSDRFILEADEWKAIITIFIDKNNYIFRYSDVYYNVLLKEGYHPEEANSVMIDNNQVVTYNNRYENENSVLCYFKGTDYFAYEVELFNRDNSFGTEKLSEVMEVLLNAKYDSKSDEKFLYYSTELDSDFKEGLASYQQETSQ